MSVRPSIRSFSSQYVVFIITILVTIASTQFVLQYDLGQQNEDARLINLAGRQRMLSQRISKRTLYTQNDLEQGHVPDQQGLDTLRKLLNDWRTAHRRLSSDTADHKNSAEITLLLKNISLPLDSISSAADEILRHPTTEVVNKSLGIIQRHELSFLMQMEKIVHTYQTEAEEKLSALKKIEWALSGVCAVVLVLEFFFIFRPVIRNLNEVNKEVALKNHELVATNEELTATEEELRSNLDFVSALKEEMSLREKQYREVIENATDMIYELNSEGLFSYVNPTLVKLTEFSADELKQKYYWELVEKESQEKLKVFYRNQLISKQEGSYLEFPITTKTGKTLWVGQNVRMYFKGNWVEKVTVVARDISRLREIQQELERSEFQYRSISEQTSDLIALFDTENRFTYVSASSMNLLGYQPEELIGTHGVDLLHPDDVKTLSAPSHIGEEKLKHLIQQFRLRKKDGTYIWIEAVSNVLEDSLGNVRGIQSVNRDITFRKETEAALHAAKQKAEEATKAKSQFLSMMSHEIRTPMNAIIGLTNLLLTSEPRADQIERLKLLQYSGENLLTIINDILDFSKIEAGKITLEYVNFDLKTALRKTVSLLQKRAEEKSIKLIFDWDVNVPDVVVGDQVRIIQVITNLVSNAIKFTEKGSVTLAVERAGNDDDMFEARFKVRDTGIGISEEQLSRIFESFSQASTDTTRKFGGTGLGLTITKYLLELMGSEINVSSVPGKGSTFSFVLRLKEGSIASDDSSATNTDNTDLEGAKILLVEDNRVNQIVASNFLKQWKVEVDFADDGREAIERIQSRDYHLVLMDLQMPTMDGYEAARIIRSLDNVYFKMIPIIALTADAMVEVRDEVLKTGMNDFITKPFNPVELKEKITTYVQQFSDFKPVEKTRPSLEEYTMGDPDLAKQLATLILSNLDELKASLDTSVKNRNSDQFRKTAHKLATSLSIIDNDDFTTVIKDLKEVIDSNGERAGELRAQLELFELLQSKIKQELSKHVEG